VSLVGSEAGCKYSNNHVNVAMSTWVNRKKFATSVIADLKTEGSSPLTALLATYANIHVTRLTSKTKRGTIVKIF
jgi:hypothetical protein